MCTAARGSVVHVARVIEDQRPETRSPSIVTSAETVEYGLVPGADDGVTKRVHGWPNLVNIPINVMGNIIRAGSVESSIGAENHPAFQRAVKKRERLEKPKPIAALQLIDVAPVGALIATMGRAEKVSESVYRQAGIRLCPVQSAGEGIKQIEVL